jgi:hypothetical protein
MSVRCIGCRHPVSEHNEKRGCTATVIAGAGAYFGAGKERDCPCYLTPAEAAPSGERR